MVEQVLLVLAGGLVGFLGSLSTNLVVRYLASRDAAHREDEDFMAALYAVVEETEGNIAVLEVTLTHDRLTVPQLRNDAYRDWQRLLAKRPPSDLRRMLTDAYVYALVPRVLTFVERTISGQSQYDWSREVANLQNVEACYNKTRPVRDRLRLLIAEREQARQPRSRLFSR